MNRKDIPGYEGIYAVDEMGDVYSYKFGKVRKLKPGNDKDGYLVVSLCKDGMQKYCKVHRLIAKVFLSDFSDNLDVDHIDRDKTNNKICNLRMVPHQKNLFNTNAKGYCWHKQEEKWQAYICKSYKIKHLGLFNKEEDARAAYLEAKKIYHII